MSAVFPQILIETIVRKAIRDIRDSPKRNTRNLIDMALNFSEGRFQSHFFEMAQSMLRDENSAYYRLIPDMVVNVDTEKIIHFGINLGYNSCTAGAKKIRTLEKKEQFNIPWSVSLIISGEEYEKHEKAYLHVLEQGKKLGIYTWMLYAPGSTDKVLELARRYPESAFVIYCNPGDITDAMLDEAEDILNIMFVVRYEEGVEEACRLLRFRNFLYSVFHIYKDMDVEDIFNEEILEDTEALHPVFTGFVGDRGCGQEVRKAVYRKIIRLRKEQQYPTVFWDISNDNFFIDSIISEDSCAAGFDKNGYLFNVHGRMLQEEYNVFRQPLSDILKRAFPKTKNCMASLTG